MKSRSRSDFVNNQFRRRNRLVDIRVIRAVDMHVRNAELNRRNVGVCCGNAVHYAGSGAA
ncbi:MAG TPA: hypothetical protein PK400_05095 [Phycisphaerales bacterium]|nr:hypothetical protein [Phycisphaerales bacterium]